MDTKKPADEECMDVESAKGQVIGELSKYGISDDEVGPVAIVLSKSHIGNYIMRALHVSGRVEFIWWDVKVCADGLEWASDVQIRIMP